MPVTLRSLLDARGLGLTILAGPVESARPISRVFVDDVDAFDLLDGGEFVLTSGVRLLAPEEAAAYLERLHASGTAVLGYRGAATLPAAVIEVAESLGLTILKVPRSTSFAAIGTHVAAAAAREEQQALSSALKAQQDLARSALSGNMQRGVAEQLSRFLGCWVLVLDRGGEVRSAVPGEARRHLARVQIDLSRFGPGSPTSSVTSQLPGESILVLPLGVDGRLRGFLAIGRATPLDSLERSVVATAVYILAADLHSTFGMRDAERRARRVMFRLLVDGQAGLARAAGDDMGMTFPEGDLRIALLGVPRSHHMELLEAAEDEQGLRSICALVTELEQGRVAVVLPGAEGDTRVLEAVLRSVPHGRGAVSDLVPTAELPDAWRRVRSVFNAAARTPGHLVVARDVANVGLLKYLSGSGAHGWAESLLAPLTAYDRSSKVDFLETLRTYLAHNGQSDASAAALGIHRHTLRYRMGKVSEILNRDVDDPAVRAELWVALQLRER